MKIAKVIAVLGVVAMSVALLNGFINGDFFEDGGVLLNNPWGIVSIVDLYVGFVLFAMWIVVRETSWVSRIVWIVALMVLGFFTGALYVLFKLLESKDVPEVFLGKHGVSRLNNESGH